MNEETRKVAILGSTGSIGTQALEVIAANKDKLSAEVLAARSNSTLLIQQALQFNPNAVAIADESKYEEVKQALSSTDIKVFAGQASVEQLAAMESNDLVLAAIVGYAGLSSTLAAINANNQVALANKESLVVAGELITTTAKKNGVNIYPVDSEHSAIFQCLVGEWDNPVEKIILTASGGPFRGKKKEFLQAVTPDQALKHPNWDMGKKVTIDSATLMNKGLEVIEARWLFGLKPEQIEVVVHPQSIVHSLVQFQDGSLKAQLGLPDMKLPIQYALSYPERLYSSFERFDFTKFPNLSFESADRESFRNLALAYRALEKGGNIPCALNASNEIAVDLFLNGKIGFLQMSELIEKCMEKISFIEKPAMTDYAETDTEARKITLSLI